MTRKAQTTASGPSASPASDPGRLLALNFGFARARVLGTALELGVFDALAGKPRSSTALALELDCDADALAKLLDALGELGLVHGNDTIGWRLAELAELYLVQTGNDYLGPHFAEVLDQWDRWAGLTRLVRTGDRGGDLGTPAGRGTHPGLFAGTYPLSAPVATELVADLQVARSGGPGRVLDYTAGSGEWGLAFAQLAGTTDVTAHDLPELLDVTTLNVRRAGAAERFSFVSGDFGEQSAAALPDSGFDTVVLAHVGRFAGAEETSRLLTQASSLLRPGGTLLLADVMQTEPDAPSLVRPMLNLSLLVNTRSGGIREPHEYRRQMEKCGITPKETVTRGLITAMTGERRQS